MLFSLNIIDCLILSSNTQTCDFITILIIRLVYKIEIRPWFIPGKYLRLIEYRLWILNSLHLLWFAISIEKLFVLPYYPILPQLFSKTSFNFIANFQWYVIPITPFAFFWYFFQFFKNYFWFFINLIILVFNFMFKLRFLTFFSIRCIVYSCSAFFLYK